MTQRGSFESALAGWLEDESVGMAPAGLHDGAMRAARVVRQRPGWLVGIRGDGDAAMGARPAITWRSILVILALVLLAAAVALVGSGWRLDLSSTLGPKNGRIMFARERTGLPVEYVTVRPDGTDEVRFMEADECGQCTFWSPDGRQIMIPMVSDDRLRTAIIAPDGSQQRILAFPETKFGLGPGAWSPDGLEVALEAVEADDASDYGIYVTASDGSAALRRVTTAAAGRTDEIPTYSPDGQFMTFLSRNSVPPPVGYGEGDLFIVRRDGTGLRQLNPPGTTVAATASNGRPIDFSPDGRQLVFSAIDQPLADGRSAIYLANVDGGQAERISGYGTWIELVEWSPDGDWIIWGEVHSQQAPTWIARPDGTGLRQLTGPGAPISGCCATWSPDGTRLLFQLGDSIDGDLWTMDLDGELLDQITDNQTDYVWFSWAPPT